MWLSAPVHKLIVDRERRRVYTRKQNGNAVLFIVDKTKYETVGEKIPRIEFACNVCNKECLIDEGPIKNSRRNSWKIYFAMECSDETRDACNCDL